MKQFTSRLMFRFVASIFTLLLTLSVVQSGAAQSAEDVRKALRDFEAKIDDGSATESDLQRIQGIYSAETNEVARLSCTQLAAKYRRLIDKNPIKSLEILLPYLIGKERTTAWIKAKSGDLPIAEAWLINDKTAHIAIEAAYALAMLDKGGLGICVANEVGKQFSDESRVLAAECIADIYLAAGRTDKSHEFLRYSAELLDRINKGQYAEKTARRFDRHDRDSVGRRVGRKFDLAVQVAENKRFGADWPLYRDARRSHKDGDFVSAYLTYMELARGHSVTIFADVAHCHAIEILTLRASKDSAQKLEPIVKRLRDDVSKLENALKSEMSRNANDAVLDHYRARIASAKRSLEDIARIPEGPAALDMAEREAEKFFERNPSGPFRGEAMYHVGLARLNHNMDAAKAEHWLRRAEEWFRASVNRLPQASEKVRHAAKQAAEMRVGQDTYDFAEFPTAEDVAKQHGNTLLWLGVVVFANKDHSQAALLWQKRNEKVGESSDSITGHLARKAAQGSNSPLAQTSEPLSAKNPQLHLAMHVADMHLALGNTAEAERLFQTVLNSKPGSANKHAAAYCVCGLAEAGLKRDGATKKNVDMLLEFAPGKKYADTHVAKTALCRLADCLPQNHPMKEKVRKHVAQKYPEGNATQ